MSMNRGQLERVERQLIDALAGVREMLAVPEVTSVPTPANDDAALSFADYGKFYDFLRGNKMLGPAISKSEFQGCDSIIRACIAANWPVAFVAYALATAYHETAHTMQPIKERGGTAYFTRRYDITGQKPDLAQRLGNLDPGDGAKYAGRGYVQLTGRHNYATASGKLGVNLLTDPDLAMRPDIAAAVMVLGMQHGWFTTRKLSDDLPANGPASAAQFKASRDIINGRDKDDEIAAYAVDFQSALLAGGYRKAA